METEIRSVDGTNVVFQYGRPVPSFETWRGDEPTRSYEDLNGEWRFRFDPTDRGVDDGWFEPGHDDTYWRRVEVPLPWDLYDTPEFSSYDGEHWGDGTGFYDGAAWYRRRVTVDESWEDRYVRLAFLAAFYRASVYVNGEHVGDHEGGHTPFALDVSDHLVSGENVIAVRVERFPWWDGTGEEAGEIHTETAIPAKHVDYWPYAGITRDVYLEATAPVTVSKLLVDSGDGNATLRAVLYNHTDETVTRDLALTPGDGAGGDPVRRRVTLEPGGVRVVSSTHSIPDATEWSTSSPTTYEASATLEAEGTVRDRLTTRYGMRTISTDGPRLLVNDSTAFLKGTNWHEESPEHGRSMTIDDYDRELGLIEETNANFVRNCVYNRHPYVYEYADENGIYLLEDADNMWLETSHERTQLEYGLSRAIVATTVWNQYNRPSVIMWCIQNESSTGLDRDGDSDDESSDADSEGALGEEDEQIEDPVAVYRDWIADMKAAVTAIDSGQDRPVTWAAHRHDDPAFDLADVVGVNEYFGFFYGDHDDLSPKLSELHEQYPEKPILITENGTWSTVEDRNDDPGDPEEEGTPAWHARSFQRHWEQVTEERHDRYLAGYAFWVFKDYKQRSDYNRLDANGISTMGAISFDTLEPHGLYDAMRTAFDDER